MDEELVKKIVRSAMEQIKPQKVILTLEIAKALCEKIEQKAIEWNMKVVVAIADEKARPIAIHCMDGAYIGSYDVAVNKTFTAIAFQMPTKELAKLSQPGAPLYGIQNTNNGKIVIFGGGEPLYDQGELIGSLGVSGGTAEQDTALAEYGKEILKEVLQCL